MPHLFDFAIQDSEQSAAALAEALRICKSLRDVGHVAYFAGGCVRDALLHRRPKDFDVATDATPERVREVFGRKRTLAFGASFGVIGVLPEQAKKGEGIEPTEVATFRSDGEYSDGRRPDKVHFGDAENDALRRDFTINGLFYDPNSEQVIDFVGGQKDLVEKRLRTIGRAKDRFEEDKLRMLRAVRFATTLGFSLCEETFDEIKLRSEEIVVVSAERVGAEMRRVLVSPSVADGILLLNDCRLQPTVMPGINLAKIALLHKRVANRSASDFSSSIALVLVSMADSPTDALQELTACWRLSNEESRQASFAIQHWNTIVDAHRKKWSEVQPVLIDRDAPVAIEVADRIASADEITQQGVSLSKEALDWDKEKLDPPPLLTGDTLRRSGLNPGPQFRIWLQDIRNMQLDGEIATEEEALSRVRSFE